MRLFKYLHPDRVDVLERKRIRFTQPTACNDPFEFRPIVEGLQNPAVTEKAFTEEFERLLGEKLAAAQPQVRELFDLLNEKTDAVKVFRRQFVDNGVAMFKMGSDHIKEMLISGLGNHVGILALTEDPASTLMWAHYASSGSGFVIEFEGSDPWFSMKVSGDDEFRHLRKVSYVSQPKSPYLQELDGHDIFYTKLSEWAYEREWRLVRPLQDASDRLGEDIYLFSFPPEIIRSVIFGLRTSPSTVQRIQDALNADSSLNHIKVGKVSQSLGSSSLTVEM